MPFSLCPACRLPSTSLVSNHPCEDCQSSLLQAPPICAVCLGFACIPDECRRPWLAVNGANGEYRFDSVTAPYLVAGPGARVLKSWKTAPSPSLTRHLLSGVRARLLTGTETKPLLLIPVPQSAARRWELEGGSVMRLCSMMLEARANHEDVLYDLLEVRGRKDAQAMSRGDARYAQISSISVRDLDAQEWGRLAERAFHSRITLVDDFLTSGATLRTAAKAVREKFAELGVFRGREIRLDVFVLGFRPALFDADTA